MAFVFFKNEISTPFWTQNWTNLFENEFLSWKTCRNLYFTCFHLKKMYRLKSYPIHVMSLSIRYIIYAKRMHDKWKQTTYTVWFLRRCDSKPSNGNEVSVKKYFDTLLPSHKVSLRYKWDITWLLSPKVECMIFRTICLTTFLTSCRTT